MGTQLFGKFTLQWKLDAFALDPPGKGMTLNSVTVTGKEVKDEILVRVTWVWIDILHMLLHMNVDGRKLYQAGQPAHPDPKSCSSKIFLQYRMKT